MSGHLAQRSTFAFFEKHPEEALLQIDLIDLRDLESLIRKAKPRVGAMILSSIRSKSLGQIVSRLDDTILVALLSEFDAAKMILLFNSLDEEVRAKTLARLPSSLRKEAESMISYAPDTAGSLMDPKVLAFTRHEKVSSVLSRLRKVQNKQMVDVFLIDEQKRLIGRASVQELAISAQNELLGTYMKPVEVYVNVFSPKDEVVEAFEKFKVITLPVTHIDGELLGFIRHEALVLSLQDQVSSDLVSMVGGNPDEQALSSSMVAVKKRLPWLLVNLLTAFLASAVVGIFESTIAKISALAVLLPVVAGQSGNTGAQAMAVTMRGLSLREIRIRHWPRVLLKECGAGLLNGLAVALITSLSVILWSGQLVLGVVIGTAMVISMILASISGAAVPLLLSSLGRDPAQSSSIVLTTVTDVVGFLSFLGLATAFASLLLPN